MKIVNENGRNLVAQHIFKQDEIKPGSTWAPADGSNYTVEVVSVIDGWVTYKDAKGHVYDKDWFSFQTRYCLVVLDGEPEKPMKTFKVTISATVIKTIEVDAENEDAAEEIAHQAFTVDPDGEEEYYKQEALSIKEILPDP